MVFSAVGEGDRDIYLLDLKQRRVTQVTKSAAYESEPAISPDGKRIAFVARQAGDREQHIYVSSPDGQNQQQLTSGDSGDRSPAFSPDGSQLVFARSRQYNAGPYRSAWEATRELCVVNVDGSGLREIGEVGLYVVDPRFSSDGQHVVFWNGEGIFSVVADGSRVPKQIADPNACSPSYSPDGTSLLYCAGKSQPDQTIFLKGSDGQIRRIVGRAEIPEKTLGYCAEPSVSPDGSRVFFLFRFQPPGVNGVYRASLWAVDLDSRQPFQVASPELFDAPLEYFARGGVIGDGPEDNKPPDQGTQAK
jgi:TolB protein